MQLKMEDSSGSQELINFRSEIIKLNNGSSTMKSSEEDEPPPDLITTQYINIHRVTDSLSKEYVDCDAAASAGLINSDLMQHHMNHSGMVVDMMVSQSPTDYSQHHLERTALPQYNPEHYTTTEDLLPHDLTEEDRHLAAALVAVQLSQQQKIQLNHHSIVTSESNVIVSPGGTPRLLGSVAHVVNKVPEHQQMTTLSTLSPVPVDKPAMSAMVSSYIQAVEEETAAAQAANNVHHLVPVRTEHHHVERIMKMYQPQQQHLQMRLPPLPPLKKALTNHSIGVRNQYLRQHMQEVAEEDREDLIEIDGRLHHQVLMVDEEEHDIQGQDELIKEEVHYVVKNEGLGLYYEESQDTPQNKNDSDYEVENDMRTSRRSLPHKKRIPRKLKNIKCFPLPVRSISSKSYKCTKCGEQFDSPSLLAAHRLTHSANKKLFNCEICNKGFAHQLKFFEHLKSHYEPLMTINNGAESSSAVDSKPVKDTSLIIESKIETKGFSVSLSCNQCGKTFKRQKAFETHIHLAHPKQVELEEFSEPEDLMEGIREVVDVGGVETGDEGDLDMPQAAKGNSPADKSWYPDEELHAAEADIQELEQQHQQQQQQQQQAADNMCDFCGEVFEDKEHVDLHVHEVHYEFKDEPCKDENESPLPKSRRGGSAGAKRPRKGGPHLSCPQCGRLFNHRNSLVYHLRSHSGERPHQCEVCGKSFFAASALKVHMRLHSGDKPYKCEFCGRHFRQWGDLKYHCISIHSEEKNYQCEYCGKDFARKYSLIVHRRIHTGEKNYKCEFCDKSFRASSYLQNHRRIHTGEKPHPCEVCGKPFRVRSDMKRHLNTHNRDRERPPRAHHHSAMEAVATLLGEAEPKLEDEQDAEQQLHGSLLDQDDSVHEITIQVDEGGPENILPDESVGDGEPINLNIAGVASARQQAQLHQQLSAATQVSEEVLHYSRDPLEMVREGGNTLYVWPVYMA